MHFPSFVTTILIADRYHGAPAALIIGAVIGIFLQSLALLSLSAFPNQTIKDVLREGGVSRWISVPLHWYLIISKYVMGLLWGFIFAKLFSLHQVFSDSEYVITGLLVVAVLYAVRQESVTILFVLEVSIVLTLPFTAIFFVNTISDNQISWDAIGHGATYVRTLPTWEGIAAASFLFSGFTYLTWFQKDIGWKTSNGRPSFSRILLITTGSGVFLLLAGYFIPIGFFGMEALEHLNFMWFSVTDSVRMEWFVVERVAYLYILLMALFTFIIIISSWHFAFEFAKSMFINRPKKAEWLILAVFAAVPFGLLYVADMNLWIRISRYYLISQMIGNLCLVALLIYSARKKSYAYV